MAPLCELAIDRLYTAMREACYKSAVPSTIEISARAEDAHPRSGERRRHYARSRQGVEL